MRPERRASLRAVELKGKRIAILATNGFEQSELEVPRDRLTKAGAAVDIVSLAAGEIKGVGPEGLGLTQRSFERDGPHETRE